MSGTYSRSFRVGIMFENISLNHKSALSDFGGKIQMYVTEIEMGMGK